MVETYRKKAREVRAEEHGSDGFYARDDDDTTLDVVAHMARMSR